MIQGHRTALNIVGGITTWIREFTTLYNGHPQWIEAFKSHDHSQTVGFNRNMSKTWEGTTTEWWKCETKSLELLKVEHDKLCHVFATHKIFDIKGRYLRQDRIGDTAIYCN